jgi:hypothetical protein
MSGVSKDVWHRERETLAQLYLTFPRRWGMRVTVYNDGGNSGDYVLSYGLSNTDKNDNANWLKVANIGVVWGTGGGATGWDRLAVDVSLPNLALDMGSRQQREFTPSGIITAPKTWVISNGGSAFEFRMIFELDAAHAQTMPADFQMTDPMFNPATQVWTPLDPGVYEAYAVYNGTNWFLTITGLFS